MSTGSAGIAGGIAETGGYATSTPTLNWKIESNNVSATDGSGIRVIGGVDDEDGFLNVAVRNNTFAAPGGLTQGIAVRHNGTATDPSETDICLDISGNTSAGATRPRGVSACARPARARRTGPSASRGCRPAPARRPTWRTTSTS